MNEEVTQQLSATAERLATAAESLDRVLQRLDSQQEALNAKIDRIVAAVEEHPADGNIEAAADRTQKLEDRISDLEKANQELKAQAARMSRKTLSPLAASLLSKSGAEAGEKLDPALVDKTLQTLSVDQRIAVKAEMARAGMID